MTCQEALPVHVPQSQECKRCSNDEYHPKIIINFYYNNYYNNYRIMFVVSTEQVIHACM